MLNFVSRSGIIFSRMHSPIGRSAQFCTTFLRFLCRLLDVLNEVVRDSCCTTEACIYQHCDRINVIRELLAVKHGYLELHLFSSLVFECFY